jgi:transaldolase
LSTDERLAALSAAGVSIWLDDLSRERLRSGNLTELIENWNVVGVTTNPTIFASALSHGDAYDQQVRELARRGADIASAIREITVADVRQACDVFSDTWKVTDGLDGRVSLEVDPTLARDTDATVAERATCGRPWIDPTCWSRSPPPSRAWWPSFVRWPRASA